MWLGRTLAFLSVGCWFLALAGPADAAIKKSARRASAAGVVSGIVVKGHGNRPVAGAHVHLVGHHARHRRHSRSVSTVTPAGPTTKKSHAAKARVFRAVQHRHAAVKSRGVLTGRNGRFSLKAASGGSHLVVAHKKHVGSGHARVSLAAGQSVNVTIRLHKHHHSHAKVAGVNNA